MEKEKMPIGARVVVIAVSCVAQLAVASDGSAQVDLAGQWAARYHEDSIDRQGGPDPGEYVAIPINDANRRRGDAWDASLISVPEHQCIEHSADYGPSFSNLRIWKQIPDPSTNEVVAWHTQVAWMNATRTIWMDGRPHPSQYAARTWGGFSTGKWEGDMLTVETTHLKQGYVRRNGLARSEKATVREHFIRNGNILTWITIVTDPVYLTEPYIRSRNFVNDPGVVIGPFRCQVEIEVDRPEGVIPHYLPGTNPFLHEWAAKHYLPLEVARGGAEMMYPEFMIKLKTLPTAKAPPAVSAKPAAASGTRTGTGARQGTRTR